MRSRGAGQMLTIALAAVVLAACVGPRSEPPPREPDPVADPDLPADIAEAIATRTGLGLRSDADYVEALHADPESVRHEIGLLVTPGEAAELDRRFAAQEDLGALAAYGAEHPETFGGMYIDQAAGGDVVLLFTRDVELHARAADALAPAGVIVRVRRVDFTEAELTEVMDGLDIESMSQPGLEIVGGYVDIIRNVVTLEVKTDDPAFEQRLEAAHGGHLEVIAHPLPGPWQNANDGDGWRLIGAGLGTLDPYTVDAATDASAYRRLWEATGLEGDAPEVRLADEVVVAFGHGISLSCPEVRLDGVDIGDETVWSVTSDPLQPRVCTADLSGTHVFVVALGRASLPDDGFTLWLNEYAADRGGNFSAPLEVELP